MKNHSMNWFLTGVMLLLVLSSPVMGIDFEESIEPILRERCWDCHGQEVQESQFRLDRLTTLLKGGDSGEPAVVPGKPNESFLLKLIRHEEPGLEMPPGESLSKSEIQLIETWIAEGAKTPAAYGSAKADVDLSHWAFQPVQRDTSGSIDGYIHRKLDQAGLRISDQADKRVLIRRLYLVMLGIPPTPAEVDAFVNDQRPNAWDELVETVLASPRYGERWATYWLDLVRFGETHGFETNRERPNAWRFRDWVIESFNTDKPYDQFIREQLAGDALGEDIGTGYLVAGPYDLVKGQDPKLRQMQRMNELDDMINTTGTAFLGLTTGCARCHNHKFDPISQRDYYALQAVFAGVSHGDRALPLSQSNQQEIAQLDVEIAQLKAGLKKFLRSDARAVIALDESAAIHAEMPRGTAEKSEVLPQDLGDRTYTWWNNKPGEQILAYRPQVAGEYRVWLSWGAGYASHSPDAKYQIKSTAGLRELATVNQQLPASGTGEVNSVARWSRLYDAGVHQFEKADEIVLIGGQQGTAITADVVVLQSVDDSQPPRRRLPVNSKVNEERFAPRMARFVRFSILKTTGGEGCLDELEIYSAGRNVALASEGARATSSGNFVHPKHKIEHINDGQHGNDRSWIVSSKAGGWVQIEFPQPVEIDRIVWGRDRKEQYRDRLPIDYRIESALDPEEWSLVATSDDRLPYGSNPDQHSEYQFDAHPAAEADEGHARLKRLEQVQKKRDQVAKQPVAYAGNFSQPGPTHRLYRGEPDAKREQVGPGAIEVFTTLDLAADSPEQKRRLALANWIASKENRLTARVIVNRLWQFHFGTGIVDTPSDFGRNGARPSHPELLDWLAVELMENGWSLKHIHRQILTSQTWMQNNRPRAEALQVDAGSRLLWRFPPRRLEAEGIRDSILSVTGVLNCDQMGGPGFSPFQVDLENVRHYHAKEEFGPEDWRRMIYMTKVRQEREQVFGVFDCPDASMVVPKRSRSTTPLQALNLLNSHFVMQQAELFSQRLEREASSVEKQVELAWQLCFQRSPDNVEVQQSLEFIQQQGIVQFSRALLNTNEFVFIP